MIFAGGVRFIRLRSLGVSGCASLSPRAAASMASGDIGLSVFLEGVVLLLFFFFILILLPLSALEILRRRQDCDAPPRMQSQQIGLSRKNQVCPAIQSYFEKLVIFGIAAFADRIHTRHQLGYAPKQPQELLTVGKTDIAVELGAGQNVSQFVHGGFGHE
jgi:hypothetical protein